MEYEVLTGDVCVNVALASFVLVKVSDFDTVCWFVSLDENEAVIALVIVSDRL